MPACQWWCPPLPLPPVYALTAAEGLKSANRKQARERRVEDEQVFRLRPSFPLRRLAAFMVFTA